VSKPKVDIQTQLRPAFYGALAYLESGITGRITQYAIWCNRAWVRIENVDGVLYVHPDAIRAIEPSTYAGTMNIQYTPPDHEEIKETDDGS
jgi:hypothetical protein